MAEYAAVESFEALQRLRTALCRFAEAARTGLDEADAELQRADDWVRCDRSAYWKREGDRRAERFQEARRALARKQAERTPLGGRYSCVEEEQALALATRRLEEAGQKRANVRKWSLRLSEEAFAYRAVAAGLSNALTTDFPNYLARLDRMLEALEAYIATPTPEMQVSLAAEEPARAGPATGAASMARPLPPEPSDLVRELRARTPQQAVRDALPLAAVPQEWAGRVQPVAARAALPAAATLRRVPAAPTDKIVVARAAGARPRVYLGRGPVCAGDSGWYAGPLEPPAAPLALVAVRVADLLALRPELAPVLELPPGFLVVIDGTALEAVYDDENRQLVPDTGGRSP